MRAAAHAAKPAGACDRRVIEARFDGAIALADHLRRVQPRGSVDQRRARSLLRLHGEPLRSMLDDLAVDAAELGEAACLEQQAQRETGGMIVLRRIAQGADPRDLESNLRRMQRLFAADPRLEHATLVRRLNEATPLSRGYELARPLPAPQRRDWDSFVQAYEAVLMGSAVLTAGVQAGALVAVLLQPHTETVRWLGRKVAQFGCAIVMEGAAYLLLRRLRPEQ